MLWDWTKKVDMLSNGVIMVLSALTLLILVIVDNENVSKKEVLHPNFPKSGCVGGSRYS
jgi:hypothetical protein